MKIELKKLFRIDEVDHYELGRVLLAFFHSSTGTEKGYKFGERDKPEFVEFVFNKKGEKIIDILLSNSFPKEMLDEISKQIEEKLIKNQNQSVGQVICFTTAPLNGHFRYKDLFQILPVPDGAPKAPDMVSPQPFLLQYSFISSPDAMIASSRRQEEIAKWVHLLNGLLNRPISLHDDSSSHRTWVMNPDKNHISECLQNGYNYVGFNALPGAFSPIGKEIGRIPTNRYYSDRTGIDGNTLQIPEAMEALLDKALALREKRLKKLYRACSWYGKAFATWGVSRSSSFVALVSALESLEEDPKMCHGDGHSHLMSTGAKCPVCGEPRFDITLHFKELMDKFFPELKDHLEERDIIYRIRSSLAHGAALLVADWSPGASWLMHKRGWDEDERHRFLFDIVKIVIIRWLEAEKVE